MTCKHLIIGLFCSLFTTTIFAQQFTLDTTVNRQIHLYAEPYKKAIGVKMFPGALSYKTFTQQNKAIEAIGYVTLDGLSLAVLKEFYAPINDVDQLTWYYGFGGHLGIWSEEFKRTNLGTSNSNIAVGFDGVIGLDYKIKKSPLNISLDWQPSFSIIKAYFSNAGGIGIRYTF
jgi:hypothetical protein